MDPEVRDAFERLATDLRAELRSVVDASAAETRAYVDTSAAETRAYIHASEAETRRHFDVVAEGLRSDIRAIAEGHAMLNDKLDGFQAEVRREFRRVDRRLLRLEARR